MFVRFLTRAAAIGAFAALAAGCGGGGNVTSPTLNNPVPVSSAVAGGSTGAAPGASAAPGTSASPLPSPAAIGGSVPSGDAVGAKPGPDILRMAPAQAPQLANTGIWSASPILVSGASAYRQGEYLYQDFLYDDYGAKGALDAMQSNEANANLLAMPNGTYSYPTDPKYADNAADLVEFRMKLTNDSTAFRVTLNSMMDPSVYAFTIALGGATGTTYAIPHGANAVEPARYFVTAHGTTADVIDATTGKAVGSTPPAVTVDRTHRQIQVLVPFTTFDPRSAAQLRVAVATGLWNNAAGTYLTPGATSSATAPGGAAAAAPAAFFNVGFRHAEPSTGAGMPASTGTGWRDSLQATALMTGDLSPFADIVDMTKLAAGASDDMPGQAQGVPQTGHMNRILASHFEPFQGRKFTGCSGTSSHCPAEYGSALQPYSIYVPKEAAPGGGYPLTLLLHSLSSNYNQYAKTRNEMEFSERTVPSIVYTTEARGPDDWYYDLAEAEVFEAWSDVAAHYPLNTNSVALTGYSMGGYATFKLGVQFPDLFGTMQPTVGPVYVGSGNGNTTDTKFMFATLRNLPILSWHGAADELVQVSESTPEEQQLAALNLNFEWDLFANAEHLTLALNDQFAPAATYLGTPLNNVNPPHVTFVRNPTMDNASFGFVADHAYWVSGITERDATKTYGTIDVFSHGFGIGDPPVSGMQTTSGMLPQPGNIPSCCSYTGFKNAYGTPPATAVTDVLTVKATNISAIAVAPARAKVDCNATLDVTSDGPLTITMTGCPTATHTFARGRSVAASAATVTKPATVALPPRR